MGKEREREIKNKERGRKRRTERKRVRHVESLYYTAVDGIVVQGLHAKRNTDSRCHASLVQFKINSVL